jgi:hypothetical protein
VTIALGTNLSFCVKRWVVPDLWASIVREKLGLEMVQLYRVYLKLCTVRNEIERLSRDDVERFTTMGVT